MNEPEQEFSFKSFFVPLTTLKIINIIVIVGFIVYYKALFGQFIWDDLFNIVNNPFIHSVGNIFSVFVSQQESPVNIRFYRPAVFSLYTLIYSLFGQSTFFYHLVQLLLHLTNVSLIFLLFKKFFNKNIAFFLSLIFLIHPINTETVAYISNTQDILYFFFGIFALYLFQRLEKYNIRQLILIGMLLLLSIYLKNQELYFFLY